MAKHVNPSHRGELEITTVNQAYLERGDLQVEILKRGHTWLDTGTHESLLEASQFVETIERYQSFKIACLEEIAYLHGFIDKEQLLKAADKYGKSGYGQYINKLAKN